MVAEGEEQNLDKFLSSLKEGPKFASVKGIEIIEEDFKGEFDSFEIRY